jgi:hypothetical protein
LVEPTLMTLVLGRLNGSMTTTGIRARDSADRSEPGSSLVTVITADRPAATSPRTQALDRAAADLPSPRGRRLTATAASSSSAVVRIPSNTSRE